MPQRGPKPKRKEVIWSSQIAYAVGLMASDGCLQQSGRHLDFTSKDLEQIENLKNCLGIAVPIGTKRRTADESKGILYRVQWSDVTLYKFFHSIGLTPKKSLTIGALQIPDKYFFDFLRGSFDGDGCFYSYFDPRWKHSFMYYLTFCSASHAHVLWLRASIERLSGAKGHITVTGKRTRMSSIKYAKKESTIVLACMYSTESKECLSRKRLKIIAALGIVGMSLVTS